MRAARRDDLLPGRGSYLGAHNGGSHTQGLCRVRSRRVHARKGLLGLRASAQPRAATSCHSSGRRRMATRRGHAEPTASARAGGRWELRAAAAVGRLRRRLYGNDSASSWPAIRAAKGPRTEEYVRDSAPPAPPADPANRWGGRAGRAAVDGLGAAAASVALAGGRDGWRDGWVVRR
jgi:hypothetical protein